MKTRLLLLLLLVSICAFGQNTQVLGTNNTLILNKGGMSIDSVLTIPVRDTIQWQTRWGNLTIRPQDGQLYVRRIPNWYRVATSGAGSTGVITWADTISPSGRIATKAELRDSSAALRAGLALKENIANRRTDFYLPDPTDSTYFTTAALREWHDDILLPILESNTDNTIDSGWVTGTSVKTVTLKRRSNAYKPNVVFTFNDLNNIYVDGFGVNLAGNVFYVDTTQIPTWTDIDSLTNTLSLSAAAPINITSGVIGHNNSGVTPGTYTKVTVDAKGHTTVGAALDVGDVPNLPISHITNLQDSLTKKADTSWAKANFIRNQNAVIQSPAQFRIDGNGIWQSTNPLDQNITSIGTGGLLYNNFYGEVVTVGPTIRTFQTAAENAVPGDARSFVVRDSLTGVYKQLSKIPTTDIDGLDSIDIARVLSNGDTTADGQTIKIKNFSTITELSANGLRRVTGTGSFGLATSNNSPITLQTNNAGNGAANLLTDSIPVLANRTFQFPNASGTFALRSDFAPYIKFSDTVGTIATHYMLDTSVSGINSQINLKVNYADSGTIYTTPYQVGQTISDSLLLYIPIAEKGVANGVATLGSDGKLPNSQLPALAITDVFVVNSQAAMLALSAANQGDVAIRTDLQKSFILAADPYSTLSNWQELLSPTAPSTNLTLGTNNGITQVINNDNGTGVTIPGASGSVAGLLSASDYSKLAGLDGSLYELLSNKSTNTSLGTSNALYPTQNAVKTYVDNAITAIPTPTLQSVRNSGRTSNATVDDYDAGTAPIVIREYNLGGSGAKFGRIGFEHGGVGAGQIMLTGNAAFSLVNSNNTGSATLSAFRYTSTEAAGPGNRLSYFDASGNLFRSTIDPAAVLTKIPVEDNRQVSGNELGVASVQHGFGSWNNDNIGPYADFIHFNTYTDGSGGDQNLLMLSKSGIGMRLYQSAWNSSTPYSTYRDVAFVDQIPSTPTIEQVRLAGNTTNNALSTGVGFDIGTVAVGKSGTGYGTIGYNIDFTSSNSLYNYKYADLAVMMDMTNGQFNFKTAPSGTVGNPITFTNRFGITATGNTSYVPLTLNQGANVVGGVGTWSSGGWANGIQVANGVAATFADQISLGVSGNIFYMGSADNGASAVSYPLTYNRSTGVFDLTGDVDIVSEGGTGNRLAYLESDGTIKRSTIDPATIPTTTSYGAIATITGPTAVSCEGFSYTKNGDYIDVYGALVCSTAGNGVIGTITIPAASDFTSKYDVTGYFNGLIGNPGTGTGGTYGTIYADPVTDEVNLEIYFLGVATMDVGNSINIHFRYKVQ